MSFCGTCLWYLVNHFRWTLVIAQKTFGCYPFLAFSDLVRLLENTGIDVL